MPPEENVKVNSATRIFPLKFFEEGNDPSNIMDDVDAAISEYESKGFDLGLERTGNKGHTWVKSKAGSIWTFLSGNSLCYIKIIF